MLSENIFHQRGLTLLYRTCNVIIQSSLYGKFRFLIPIFYSILHVFRDLCITHPSFNTYDDVSYPDFFWTSQFNRSVKPEGPALAEPENLVRRNSLHVFLVDCVPRCLNSGFNHSHQDLVSRSL